MIRLTDSAKALLAVLSVFVTGVAVGCGLDRTILAPPSDAAAAAVSPGDPRHHEAVLADLKTRLGLSDEQAARVERIFAARQNEIREITAEIHAKLEGTMQGVTAELEAALDPVQVERLHEWLAERHGSASGHRPGPAH